MARRTLTNTRRTYLCTYDVASEKDGDKRRGKLFDTLMDHGEHVQFSVFLCILTHPEFIRLKAAAEDILNQEQYQLLFIDIGPDSGDWLTGLFCVGKTWTPPIRSRIV